MSMVIVYLFKIKFYDDIVEFQVNIEIFLEVQ